MRHFIYPVLFLSLLFNTMHVFAAKQVVFAGHFGNKAVLIIDGRQAIVETNAKAVAGVRLLSVTSDKAVVEINGRRRVLVNGVAGSVEQSDSEYLSVKIWPDDRGMYFVNGKVNGISTRFLVDTGASFVAMNSHEARRLGINYREHGHPSVAQTASGIVKTWNLRVRSISINGLELRNVGASVIEGRFPAQILLGMSFLRRVRMENSGRVMTLIQK